MKLSKCNKYNIIFFKFTIMNKRQALIVVDYQNDFGNPNGSLYVKWWELLAPRINQLMRETKAKWGIIITSQDWHPSDHISFASSFWLPAFSLREWEMKWPDHCVAGSWWANFVEWFERKLVDRRVLKWTSKKIDSYSSFGGVEKGSDLSLDFILKLYNIELLKIVGLATEYCDKATVLDGLKLGYEVEIIQSGIAAVNVNPNDGANALEEMKQAGAKILP